MPLPASASDPGQTDKRFSGDGIVRIDFGRTDEALSLLVDEAGRLTLAGAATGTLPDRVAVARLDSGGTLDSTFGNDGRALVSPGSDGTYVAAWARDASRHLLVLGGRENHPFALDAFYIIRLTPKGQRDSTFGENGRVAGTLGRGVNDMQDIVALPTGRVLILGNESGRAVVGAYKANGTRDRSFGDNGRIQIDDVLGAALLYQPGGRLLVVGTRTRRRVTVDAFAPSGIRDASFGSNGRATVSIDVNRGGLLIPPGSAAIDSDGRVVVAGQLENDFKVDVVVSRFTATGNVDMTFSRNGWRRLDLGSVDSPHAIVPVSNGHLVVVGEIGNDLFGDDPSSDLFLYGLRRDGHTWRNFGTDGLVRTDFGRPGDAVRGLDARPVGDGLMVVGRSRGNMFAARFFIAEN